VDRNRSNPTTSNLVRHAEKVLEGVIIGLAFTFILFVFPHFLAAQDGSPKFSINAVTLYQSETAVDGGGNLKVVRYGLSAGALKSVTENLRVGIGLVYELDDYDFSGLTGYPVVKPWDVIYRLGVSIPFIYSLDPQWRLFISPNLQWAGEGNAEKGDALTYGGVLGVSYAFRTDLTLGFGAGAFSNLGKTTVFPYLAVNWQITEKMKLGNPFRTSPAGPAGLELTYTLNRNWEASLGGAYRSYRFRLNEDGAISNGIGESKFVPLYLRLSYNLSPQARLDVYGGVSFFNQIRINNSEGDEIYQTNYSVPVLAGLSFTGRF
jgi:hypothetical protein